jgi:cell division septum initiation protein DivIVA
MSDPISWLSAMGAGAVVLKASEAVLKRWIEKPDRLSAEGEKIRSELRKEIERHQESNSRLRDENAALQQRQLEHLAEIGALTLQIAKLEQERMRLSAEAERSAENIVARDERIQELVSALALVTKERDRLIRGVRQDNSPEETRPTTVPTDERPALPRVKR